MNIAGSGITRQGDNKGVVNSEASIEIVIGDGVNAITTGVWGDFEVPFGFVPTGWTIVGDVSGSIVVDLWKDTYANFPATVADTVTGTEKPTLSAANKNQDLTLSSWVTSWSKGDWVRVNVDSASTVKRVIISIRGTKA